MKSYCERYNFRQIPRRGVLTYKANVNCFPIIIIL